MGVPITVIARFARAMDRIVDGNPVGVGQALGKFAGELNALLTSEFVRQGELEFTGDLGARMPPGVLGCIPKCLAVLGPFMLTEARQDDVGLVDAVPARIVKKLLQLFVPQLVARPIGRGGDGGLAL